VSVGDKQAILLKPVLEDTGYGSAGGVIFPDGDSLTMLTSNNVPLKDLLNAAEAVAAALPREAD
jgi:hypothetical protein